VRSAACPYHYKLRAGLLTDSYGRYHATPPGQSELGPSEDGWVTLAGPESDLLDQLLGWDERKLHAFEAGR
jgi:hypothetical protein